MKGYIVFGVLVGLAQVTMSYIIQLRRGNDNLWNEYKGHYNKQYDDEEDARRKDTWNDNLSNYLMHNLRYHTKQVPFKMGMNEYSDMDHEEFLASNTGLQDELDCQNSSLLYHPPPNPDIADDIDWNQKGYVTQVLNQGKCGACWAFCSIAALEAQHKRVTGNLVKLSEQQLVDCSNVTGNKGCGGGQMCRALEYATHAGGVNTASSYPVQETSGPCRFSTEQIGSPVGGYLDVPYGEEKTLKTAVGLLGPVAAGLDGSLQSFRHYKDGIFDDEACSNSTLSHAITIIGYGTENGKDYWLIKNSWGPSWGNKGFGKLSRNKNNQCGIANRALVPVLEKDEDGRPKLSGPAAN